MTVTVKMRPAGTAFVDTDILSRQFLASEVLKQLEAASEELNQPNHSSTPDVLSLPLQELRHFFQPWPVELQASNFISSNFDLLVKDIVIAGFPGKTLTYTTTEVAKPFYSFVSPMDGSTDPTPIAHLYDTIYGEPRADQLQGFEEYSKDNWDGDGGAPITAEILEYARRLLRVMPGTFGDPDIAPSADGSIGLEWVFDVGPLCKLFFDIGPSAEWRAYWRRRNGQFGRQAGKSFSLSTRRVLQRLFDDLSK